MSSKDIAFYRGNTRVSVDFSASEISSDGALVLLEKLERKHKLISYFGDHIVYHRHVLRTVHSVEKRLKQRVFMLMEGYEDTNNHALMLDIAYGLNELMNSGEKLYESIGRDIYYLGLHLDRKSFNTFMHGIILSVITFVICHLFFGDLAM